MISLADTEIVPDLSGAAFLPAFNCLLVADLHFEKGSSLARRGMIIPPFDTRSTLDQLEDVVERLKPRLVVSLGDSFHDKDGPSRLGNDERKRITALVSGRDWIWLTGNHDPHLPDDLPGQVADEIALGGLILRHEPTFDANGEICGHLHPAAAVRQRGRKLRRRCFAGNATRLFLPAFGAYTGGLNVISDAFAPYWNNAPFTSWLIGRTAIHRFASRGLVT